MPYKPKRLCNYNGCNDFALTNKSYCSKHIKEKAILYNQQSRTYNTNDVYNYRWRKLRELQLRQEPCCAACMKFQKCTPATEVDHIIPHKMDDTLFYSFGNLQSLCKSCHSQKTMREIKL